jgi:hypothetical protein
VKNLVPYAGEAIGVYDAIVGAKYDVKGKAARLLALRPTLVPLYAVYAGSTRTLETMTPHLDFTAQQKKDLLGCYYGSTTPLAKLKADIREAQAADLDTCAYCGYGEITWDHYLPSSKFPEFSVYPTNLIPCCDPCNKQRSDEWIQDGQRTILNVYYDDIDQQEILLDASITFPGDLPRARFSLNDEAAARTAFGRFFKRHCERLHLADRFSGRSRRELARMKREISSHGQRSADQVRDHLVAQAEQEGTACGVNHHHAVLLRAASRSPAFIAYCIAPAPQGGGAAGEPGAAR